MTNSRRSSALSIPFAVRVKRATRRLAFVLMLAVCAATAHAGAPDPADAARDKEIAATDIVLDKVRKNIDAGDTLDVRDTERELRELLHESRSRLSPVNRALDSAEQSLGQLGAAPKEGEPPESEPLAARREELRQRISSLQGQQTRILSNIDEAASLLAAVSARRVALLYGNLIESGTSLASPTLWKEGFAAARNVWSQAATYFSDWAANDKDGLSLLARVSLLVLAFLVSVLLIGPVHRWMQGTFTRRLSEFEPTPARRVAVAGVKMISRIVPGIVGGFAFIETARMVGLVSEKGLLIAHTAWAALIAYLLVEGFTSGLFSPKAPNWRIADVDAAKGKRASRVLLGIVAVFGVKSIIESIASTAEADPSLSTLSAGVSAVIIGALLVLLSGREMWTRVQALAEPETEEPKPQAQDATKADYGLWPHVRRAGGLVGLVIIGAALAGYIPLADFAASRLYSLALILSIAWFLRAALKETGGWAERRLRAKEESAAEPDEKHIAKFWIGLGVDFILLCALTPALLVLAGLSWRSVRDIVGSAFLGFRIGGVTISLANIFWAVGLFFLILAMTRLVQRGLERGPFAHSRLDTGVQNSLTTLLGYFGLLIALVVGVTALGFDLSNLAIIAGALSVGIGFGLQSVVSNFVSGLILLFERPMKVGDWIVTASGEGIVSKISFRSTEIETFDRSTIIVPNSELIASTVTNWTHRSRLGRIRVSIGVSYNSDPVKVREILLKCAKDHPLIVGYPEPFIVWHDFGSSSLDFDLRAYLRDIGDGLTVKTELRYAIFKAFKEAGIEIPFPQQDVHIKTWPNGAQKASGSGQATPEGEAAPVPRAPRELEHEEDD
ncbi:MAG TPA: mechanosensitive ion channel [Parvularculaceae bacterium]|nr:mechanosensitive ion channel family protein [Caulobacterales bacterium]HPE30525.1 mechanosensitive ion channel [Parvularculaceae bacterium]